MKFPYRLAVFDMDDTLLSNHTAISEENQQALQRLRAAGVEVVIASGRHFTNIIDFEESLGFPGWLISAGGAVVSHARTQEVIHEMTVLPELGLDLVQRAQAAGISLIGYHRTGIFCDQPSEWVWLYTKRTHQVPIADIPTLIGSGLQKLIWTTAPERIAELTPQLEAEFKDRLYVVNTEREMIELLHPHTNKALATQVLAEKLCVAREEIVAFGDGNNDVPLLAWAGMSVAMAHGKNSAKKAAKMVSPPGDPRTAVSRSVAMLFEKRQ